MGKTREKKKKKIEQEKYTAFKHGNKSVWEREQKWKELSKPNIADNTIGGLDKLAELMSNLFIAPMILDTGR